MTLIDGMNSGSVSGGFLVTSPTAEGSHSIHLVVNKINAGGTLVYTGSNVSRSFSAVDISTDATVSIRVSAEPATGTTVPGESVLTLTLSSASGSISDQATFFVNSNDASFQTIKYSISSMTETGTFDPTAVTGWTAVYAQYFGTYSAQPTAFPTSNVYFDDLEAQVPAVPHSPRPTSERVIWSTGATPVPTVRLFWGYDSAVTEYTVYRDGSLIATIDATVFDPSTDRIHYDDTGVSADNAYFYSIVAATGVSVSGGSPPDLVLVPHSPAETGQSRPFGFQVVRWKFTDVFQVGPEPWTYTWEINANDGGSLSWQKNFFTAPVVGPRVMPVVQEGGLGAATLDFSGIILTQTQYEAMEYWYSKRVLLLLVDDLYREYVGVFASWQPHRERRASNFWYHSYEATFQVLEYVNASGQKLYGRIN